jgi:sulfopropanediol 3-dehydrogenase
MAVQIKNAVPAERVAADLSAVRQTVQDVLGDLRARGDAALREYSEKVDGWSPDR